MWLHESNLEMTPFLFALTEMLFYNRIKTLNLQQIFLIFKREKACFAKYNLDHEVYEFQLLGKTKKSIQYVQIFWFEIWSEALAEICE